MFGVMQHLNVVICKDAEEATNRGYVYRNSIKAVEIDTAVVIREGTESGNSTVDLILKDQEGNLFVVMLTGALLKSIPC